MRVLITGGTGFIGSHLTRFLVNKGISVAVLKRPKSNPWRILDVLPSVKIINCDLNLIKRCSPAYHDIRSFRPDVVFHLAWFGVSNLYRNDPAQIDYNLKSSLNLMRLVAEAGCNRWIGLGSQAEYGKYNRPIKEDFATRPTTMYGAVKLCVCLLTQKLCEINGVDFVWLRLFSAYGPADNPNWLIPYVILKLLSKQKPSLTLGEQQWDYIYIDDVVKALWKVSITPSAQVIFNLASGKTYKIRYIVERIRDLIDPSLPLGFGEIPYQSDQIVHLEADITRLTNAISWRPLVDIDEGLKRTVEWFRKNSRRYKQFLQR